MNSASDAVKKSGETFLNAPFMEHCQKRLRFRQFSSLECSLKNAYVLIWCNIGEGGSMAMKINLD